MIEKSISREKGRLEYEMLIIGRVSYKLQYTTGLPRIEQGKFEELVEDVRQRGIVVPIVIDEFGNVIDGAHRIRAAHLLGLKAVPTIVVSGLTEEGKWAVAQDLNVHRRQLTPEQVKKIVAEHKKTVPTQVIKLRKEGKSLRQISDELGISHESVRKNLTEANAKELTVELPSTVIGKDGRKRQAKSKPKSLTTIFTSTGHETERAIRACQEAGDQLPTKNIPLKRAERIVREKTTEDLRRKNYDDHREGQTTLLCGDFKDRCSDIPDSSIDVIFTDPPYEKAALPLWNDLGELAAKKLKPGGLLVSYSGVLYLPEIHQMLGQHLKYLWTAAVMHTGGKKLIPAVRVHQAWKPILIYYKPPLKQYWKPFTDVVSGGRNKEHHAWEQAVDEAVHYVRALCPAGGTLLDPMMGSGTTVVAGLQSGLGLNCIGIEVDKAAFATAEKRVQEMVETLAGRKVSA